MPADQRNWGYSQYLSDNGTTYSMRADADWIANSASGSAGVTSQPRYVRSSRAQPRKAIFVDSTTFRQIVEPVFTPTAFAAMVIGTDTYAVHVPGETAAVTYTLAGKVGERVPNNNAKGPSRPDHA